MKNFRNDAEATYFLDQQLEQITERVYEEYPDTAYATIVPVDTSYDEGADEVGYTMYTHTGISQIISAGDADSPAVDATGQKFKIPVFDLGNHFSYTRKEVRNAKYANEPLESDKVDASALAVEQHHDDICIMGDGSNNLRYGGMYGIVFHPNVTKIAAPKTFATSTDAEILSEFAKMKQRIVADTKQVHMPDTWGISLELQTYLEGRLISGTSTSIMAKLRETYADMKWVTHYRLADVEKNPTTDAVEATPVILCYKRSPRVLKYIMPIAWRLLPSVFTGRKTKTESESTSAGVMVKQPLAVVVYHSF